jgi:membrane fusion protein, heavy metal efflux system
MFAFQVPVCLGVMRVPKNEFQRALPLCAAFLVFLCGCEGGSKTTAASDASTIQHQGARVTVPASNPLASRLQSEAVRYTTFTRQVTAPASVEADPARYARILPPLAGRVLKLYVHPGDAVKKDQELLTLDAPEFVTAQTDYARARSVLGQAERNLTRQEDLASHGIVGQREVDQTRTDRDSAQSDFNRTKDRLRLLGMDPDKTEFGAPLIVRAPLAGKVLDVTTAAGEFRNDPNAPLMTVADLSDIWLTASVQEKDIHFVHRGDPVSATFAAFPGETMHGNVLFVADVLDQDTRTAKVRVVFANRDGRLRPAMFATVTLKTWDTQELTIPTTALVMQGDQTTVFVEVAQLTFERRPVDAGEQQGGRTVVRKGLQPGDKVLVREGALLQ